MTKDSNKRISALAAANAAIRPSQFMPDEFDHISRLLTKAAKQADRGHHKVARSTLGEVVQEVEKIAAAIAERHQKPG